MRILDRISGLVSRSTGLILVLTILLTSLAVTRIVDLASGEMRLEIDPSTNRLLSEDNEARAFYDRVRRMFGSDETLVITLTSDDIFTADNFRRIDRITRRIDDLESVHHVSSLTNALDIRSIDDSLDIAPFIENVTDDPATIADVRSRHLRSAVYPQRPAREDLGHCRGGKRRQHGLAHRCTALQGRHYRHPYP
jgi:predicted RND superfamily exporter protein